MKRFILLNLLFTFLIFVNYVSGQGTENFNNYSGSSGTYTNGTFTGQDGSTWNYYQCRSDRPINPPSPCMGKNRNPTAKVVSGTLHNGCGILSFDYKQAYGTAVNLNVIVNGTVVGNVVSPGGNADTSTVHNSGPITVNLAGDFVLQFKQADSTSSGQCTIDNVTWTAFSSGPVPEPTNYPTEFDAEPVLLSITTSWVDATGTQLPYSYLIKASETNNIQAPVDGTPVPDDLDFSDGVGAKNVSYGVQTYTFNNLKSNKTYYFKIYPYTNSGTDINYKTDGNPPYAQATTENINIIQYKDFEDNTFAPWDTISLASNKGWTISYFGNNHYAYMNGYHGSESSDDWLVSPSMNFNQYLNENLSFKTAKNYTGPDLEVKISTNYTDGTDPSLATWTDLQATLSPGNWTWTPSGNIDISSYNGNNIHVAFHYVSDTSSANASAWELDDILIKGNLNVGIGNPESQSFRVYPNPTHGLTQISFPDNAIREVKVIDVLGNTVKTVVSNKMNVSLDLSGEAPGIYLINISKNDGSQPVNRKLIIR
ncbi:MAG: choice-of-anchor J domain-containing protein [Bacteroidota bacterium]|nr:choice-of-anchor J domain-containing protein [Bacteroidota bacterium]